MIGAIFAVHPVHVESVAWITERKNVLSGLFYLLSIGCYLQFKSRHLPAGQVGHWAWYAGAFGLFVLALLSKTVVATLPIALLLISYLKGWRIGRREILELVPFLVIGAAMGLLTRWYEFHIVGAGGQDGGLSMGERLLVAGRALFFYFMKLLMPVNLSFNYTRWQLDIGDPAQWFWVLAAGAVGLLCWWKRSAWGRAPFVGLAFFSVTLAPALGFFYVYPMRFSFVADHFQYLASIGIIALIIGSVAWRFDRWKSDPPGKGHIAEWMRPISGLLVLVILVTLTWKQGLIYRDVETLWQDTLNKNPSSWLAHSNLGMMYSSQGRLEEAFQEYQISLKLKPDNNMQAHNNLGNVYSRQGRLEEAIQEYLTALKIWPNYTEAHYNLANAYSRQGRLEEAIREYLAVIRLQPDNIFAHTQLGNTYLNQGRLEEAIQEFLAVLKLQPDDINAHNNLGMAYSKRERFEKAIPEYLAVLKLQPDDIDARNNLGIAYSRAGRFEEAIRESSAVLKLQPDNIFAHNNLGDTYLRQGRLEKAIQEYLVVLKLQPDNLDAHNNLGIAYSQQGRFEKAIPEYLAVLKLEPNDIDARNNLGNVYKLKGLKNEAKKQFEIILKLKPDFMPAREALKSLNSR
jgi:tetratricopeptide (TPR) repeat protein